MSNRGFAITRRRLLFLAGAAAAAGALQACGRPDSQAPTDGRGGGLVAATASDWDVFDPMVSTGSWETNGQIHDPLFLLAPDQRGTWSASPGLVDDWQIEGDSLLLRARAGVTFHDGSTWDAETLAWNLERMMTAEGSRAKAAFAMADAATPVERLDEHSVRLRLLKPAPAIVEVITQPQNQHYTWPVSRQAYEELGPDGIKSQPVGAGPFRFVNWRPGDQVQLKGFENYWMKDDDGSSLPYIEDLTIRLIPEAATRAAELSAGRLGLASLIAGSSLDRLRNDSQLEVIESPEAGVGQIIGLNSVEGPLAGNLKLRQAILTAIDREAMAATLSTGETYVGLRQFLLPGQLGYDESNPGYWYDKAEATKLRSESGAPSGLTLRMLIIARNPDRQIAQMIQQMLGEIGINVEVESTEVATFLERIAVSSGGYDIALTQNSSFTVGDPDPRLRNFIWSGGGTNTAHIEDETIDRLLDEALVAPSADERHDLYRQVIARDYELAHYGWLVMRRYNYVLNRSLSGFNALSALWNLRRATVA